MKKSQNLLFLFVLSVLAISCNKDDEDIPLTENDLITGTWEVIELYAKGKITQDTSEGETLIASFSSMLKDIRTTLAFSDNPKEVTLNGSYTTTTTVNIFGREEITTIKTKATSSGNFTTRVDVISASGEEGIDTITTTFKKPTWSLQNGILSVSSENIIIYVNEQGKAEVVSFDGKTLRLHSVIDRNIVIFGDTVQFTGNSYITMVKQ